MSTVDKYKRSNTASKETLFVTDNKEEFVDNSAGASAGADASGNADASSNADASGDADASAGASANARVGFSGIDGGYISSAVNTDNDDKDKTREDNDELLDISLSTCS